MAEKRDRKRYQKRLKLRYGVGTPSRMAFTEDISEQGIFLKLATTQIPKEVLKIEVQIPGGEPVLLEGKARWAKKVPAAVMRKCSKAGIGIKIERFLSGKSRYRELIESLRQERDRPPQPSLRPPEAQDYNEEGAPIS